MPKSKRKRHAVELEEHVEPERPGTQVISDDRLQGCSVKNNTWLCPLASCGKTLSRKQTLKSHLLSCHGIHCQTASKTYKQYEIDSSIQVPRSTYYLKKKQSGEISLPSIACEPHQSAVSEEQENVLPNEDEVEALELKESANPVDPDTSDWSEGVNAQDQNSSDQSDMVISSDEDSEAGSYTVIADSDESDLEVNICTQDPPLYIIDNTAHLWKSSITKSEHLHAVSAFACRHNLSDTGIQHLLSLIQIHIPEQNIGETNVSKVKEMCGFDNNYLKYHFYCNYCKKLFTEGEEACRTPGCTGKQSDPKCQKYFVTSDLKLQVKEVLEREGMWQAIQDAKFESSGHLCDIKNGSAYTILQKPNGFLHNTKNITFSLFTDGVPLFKSSCVSIWPTYLLINEIPPKERFLRKNMLLWGVWQGVGKPNMNMYLKPLVLDLLDLYHQGAKISMNNRVEVVKAMLLMATMDLPARAGVLNMTQHNGEFGCLYCMEPGIIVPSGKGHCRAYPARESPCERRTHATAKASAEKAQNDGKRTDGFIGESVLLYLPYFSITDNVVIDYMHGILLGITKMFLGLWFDRKHAMEPYNISDCMADIDKQLRTIHPPSMIHRHPRVLTNTYHHWKASELRNWLLFYSLPCLLGRLPEVYLTHFSCLVEGTYILLSEDITAEDLCRADLLLKTFVENLQNIYQVRCMGINVHNLTHLVECVKLFGPLWGFSCFAFESFNGELKRSIHGTGNVCKQMFWFLQAQKRIEQKAKRLADGEGKKFLQEMIGESRCLSSKSEAYQCCVGKLHSVSTPLSAEVKTQLFGLAGTDELTEFLTTSKISRNGFLMYSRSSSKFSRQNSYTIALENSSEHVSAIEVQMYLLKSDSRRVFAIGKIMESTESILPRRCNHLKKFVYSREGLTVVRAEHLREPLVVVNCADCIYAAFLPNRFERD